MTKGKGMLGWMVGMMTGAALGMLFATRPGKEVREKIKRARAKGDVGYEPMVEEMKRLSQEMSHYAKDSYKDSALPEVVKEWRGKLKGFSDEFLSNVSDFHDEQIQPLKNKAEKGAVKAKQAVKKLKATVSVARKAAKDVKKIVKK